MNEILKKRIEEAELAFADREYEVGEIDHNALRKGFFHGAEYALSHQWISVDEVLPEYEEDVLALIGGAPVIAKGYHVRAGLRYNTHWMPIPKFEQQSKM